MTSPTRQLVCGAFVGRVRSIDPDRGPPRTRGRPRLSANCQPLARRNASPRWGGRVDVHDVISIVDPPGRDWNVTVGPRGSGPARRPTLGRYDARCQCRTLPEAGSRAARADSTRSVGAERCQTTAGAGAPTGTPGPAQPTPPNERKRGANERTASQQPHVHLPFGRIIHRASGTRQPSPENRSGTSAEPWKQTAPVPCQHTSPVQSSCRTTPTLATRGRTVCRRRPVPQVAQEGGCHEEQSMDGGFRSGPPGLRGPGSHRGRPQVARDHRSRPGAVIRHRSRGGLRQRRNQPPTSKTRTTASHQRPWPTSA